MNEPILFILLEKKEQKGSGDINGRGEERRRENKENKPLKENKTLSDANVLRGWERNGISAQSQTSCCGNELNFQDDRFYIIPDDSLPLQDFPASDKVDVLLYKNYHILFVGSRIIQRCLNQKSVFSHILVEIYKIEMAPETMLF